MDDDQIIARVRSALDEVARGIDEHTDLIPVRPATVSRRPLLGVAAATLLLAGAATFALLRRSSDDPAADAVTTTEASTTTVPDVSTIDPASIWYTLPASDLTVGTLEQQAQIDGPSNPVMTWIATTGSADGVLALTQYFDAELGPPRSNASEVVIDGIGGSQLRFLSYGMTVERRDALIDQVVPGSGLPFVLPDPSMQLLSLGDLGPATKVAGQTYSLGTDWATITVGTDRGIGNVLALSTALSETTVDGFVAYRSTSSDGTVSFEWSPAPGRWASLTVSSGLADRADELAASLVRAPLPRFADAG